MSEIAKEYKKDFKHNGDFGATGSGDYVMVEGIENVKQRLTHRLITSQGSIVHRPNFGVGIKKYQGAVPSLQTQTEIALKIRSQFLQDPNVTAVEQISVRSDGNIFYISAKVTVEGYGATTFEAEV